MSEMLNTVFYLLLNMSITSTAIGLLIVFLRQVKLISRRSIYIMWGFIFVRLIIPVAFSCEVSILNLARKFIEKLVVIPSPGNKVVKLTISNVIGTAKTYFPVIYKNQQLERIFTNLAKVWLFGVILIISIVIVMYFLAKAELREANHVKDNIYRSQLLETPMVYGIFKQKIIIPYNLRETSEEYVYVLLQE